MQVDHREDMHQVPEAGLHVLDGEVVVQRPYQGEVHIHLDGSLGEDAAYDAVHGASVEAGAEDRPSGHTQCVLALLVEAVGVEVAGLNPALEQDLFPIVSSVETQVVEAGW